MRSIFTLTCILLSLASSAIAELKLPAIFNDHLVLQRGLANPVWGWADPGASVTVKFSGQEKTATADDAGEWKVKLDPIADANSEPQTISISSGQQLQELKDVLIGDVWICSGQSNMEWRVSQSANPQEEIAAADHPLIRIFDVQGHTTSGVPKDDLRGTWNAVTPQTIAGFSAVGFYFGREQHQQTGVPIGLIGTNWGGTRVEPWTPPVGFASVPELKNLSDQVKANDPTTEEGKAKFDAYLKQMETWVENARKTVA
ncbi:MAG: sialate O-acetylesterase, partial [Verrucomicrobiota bacterium]